MNVLFLQDSGLNESLALTELSAYLKSLGHRADLLLLNHESDPWAKAKRFDPALVAVASSILAPRWSLRTAARVRKEMDTVPILLVGSLPTLSPQVLEDPSVDFICVGEAEVPVGRLCEALDHKRDPRAVEGIGSKEDGRIRRNSAPPPLSDWADLPLPDRGIYHKYDFIRRFGWKKFLTGRGCAYECDFCYLSGLRLATGHDHPRVRLKTPPRVVEEILAVRADAPIRTIHFSDDLFGLRPDWLEEFSEFYASRIGIPFTCNTCAEIITDRSARALKKAGCRGVGIGIEVGDAAVRREELNKRTPDRTYQAAAERLHREGIKLMTLNMVGLPGESAAGLFQLLRLNKRLKADFARVQYAVPLPGTPFGQRASAGSTAADSLPDFTEDNPSPRFGPDGDRTLENVYSLFRLAVSFPRCLPLLERIAPRLPRALARPALLAAMVHEKRFSGIGLIDGLRYYWNVGTPTTRTSNFPSLI